MTKDETLDWLYRLKSNIFVYMPKPWLIPMGNALDMAIKALEQEPRWIPVSERLPEKADCYAVTEKIGDDLIVKACFFDRTGNWHDDSWINHERNYLTNVVAWMPMPEPYEPQESEDKENE